MESFSDQRQLPLPQMRPCDRSPHLSHDQCSDLLRAASGPYFERSFIRTSFDERFSGGFDNRGRLSPTPACPTRTTNRVKSEIIRKLEAELSGIDLRRIYPPPLVKVETIVAFRVFAVHFKATTHHLVSLPGELLDRPASPGG